MANTITVAAPPSTTDVASYVLATMAAQSGVVTDYNPGSQIRTQAEAVGAVVERQSIWTQAIVFQGILYSAMSLFGITPLLAASASGVVNIVTAADPAVGPPATQNVSIPSGTLLSTVGGTQYMTSGAVLLTAGSSGVATLAIAVTPGAAGNVAASGVTQIVSALPYPLFAVNPQPMVGGADAETFAQTLARFTPLIRSIGLASPGALANAAIGVTASGTGETVQYATLYEPWLAAGSGVGSGVAGYTLYIDNGAGAASSGLIAAVTATLNANAVSGATNPTTSVGYRPAGVPFMVAAAAPTQANVAITAVVGGLSTVGAAQAAFQSAISGYFTLPFGATAQNAQLTAAIANSQAGLLDSLSVTLTLAGSTTAVSGITPSVYGRVVLNNLSLNISQGS